MMASFDKKMKMQSDVFFNEKEDKEYCVPVDQNGGFVPTKKGAKDNLKQVEQSTRWRFGLQTAEDKKNSEW